MKVRRALIRGRHDVVMETIDLEADAPRQGELLLRTSRTFISAGTELANYTGLDPTVDVPGSWNHYPWTPGYANVSRVEAVGPGVEGFSVGERVFTFTRHRSVQLFKPAGGMIVKVPDGVEDEVAAASRMACVAITALQVADLALDDFVVVYGLGAVGNLAAQFFHLSGARVIGVDPAPARCELALKCGIDHAITATGDAALEQIKHITGSAARVAVDAVGDSRVVNACSKSVTPFGDVILLGSPRAAHQGDITDQIRPVHWKWVSYKGALEWRIPTLPQPGVRHSIVGNANTILSLIRQKKLHVKPLISHRVNPEDIKAAYDGLLNRKDEYTGVVLDWLRL